MHHTATGFVPVVHALGALEGTALLRELQEHVSDAIRRSPMSADVVPCDIHGLYVTNHAVDPHEDKAEDDMLARGMVILSDGHRLHSRRLDAAGVTQGLPLAVGDVYELDPFDEHWTTVPAGAREPILAFHVTGDAPDDRGIHDIVREMTTYLEEELRFVR